MTLLIIINVGKEFSFKKRITYEVLRAAGGFTSLVRILDGSARSATVRVT